MQLQANHTAHRTFLIAVLGSLAVAALLAGCTGAPAPIGEPSPTPSATADATAGEGSGGASVDTEMAATVRQVAEESMGAYGLNAAIVRVTRGGEDVATFALGESMTGVPATPDMHFRNGAVAISLVATALLQLVDEGIVSLDDPISEWLPDVPNSEKVTLGQLANMTSGYADYLWDPVLLTALWEDPFRQWEPEELYTVGTSKPLVYEPGTNWNYSHTNYVLLGLAMEEITGQPMDELMREKILGPLGLENTDDPGSAAMPDPVLHAYTSERRSYVGVPADTPFMEDSTFWSPSYTITHGAIQYTDIYDMARTAEAIGTGELLSPESHAAQVDVGLRGKTSVIDGCPACFPQSEIYTYGIGVVMMGDWILQNPSFNGFSGTAAYLPEEELVIAVTATYSEAAFDDQGGVSNHSTDLFRDLVSAIAPDYVPPVRTQ